MSKTHRFPTCIGNAEFYMDNSLSSMHISSEIQMVNVSAFQHCKNLTQVTFDEGVKRIDIDAFAYSGIEEVFMPDSIEFINRRAFSFCSKLKRVKLPENIKEIRRDLFLKCVSLGSITIPETVTRLEQGAFFSCGSLTDVVFPSQLTSIEKDCFGSCVSLTRIDIPEGVKSVDKRAFAKCLKLESINFPDSIETIGDFVIENCKGVVVYVPSKRNLKIGILDWLKCNETPHTIHYKRGIELPTVNQIYDDNLLICDKVIELITMGGNVVPVTIPCRQDHLGILLFEKRFPEEKYKQALINAAAEVLMKKPEEITVCLETGVVLYVDNYFVNQND